MTHRALAVAALAVLTCALLVVVLAGCGTAAPVIPVSAPAATTTSIGAAQRPVGDPVAISIPKLDITDDVVPVGLEPDRSLEVPPVDKSGWFRLGPRPGDVGSALIAGHVNWHGQLGALGRIGELAAGDLVLVTDQAGVQREFGVLRVYRIPKALYQTRTVPLISDPRTSRDLALVTCSGSVTNGEYSDNTVVMARLVT